MYLGQTAVITFEPVATTTAPQSRLSDRERGRRASYKKYWWSALLTVFLFVTKSFATDLPSGPLLLRDPTISKRQVSFAYAGCIWIVNRDGGDPRRLTDGGHEGKPFFSPDGALVAFTGNYNGSRNVFVISVNGGTPRQLTYHPADIDAAGWTPDGQRVLFTSGRNGFAPKVDENTQLFSVSINGGFATPVPLKRIAAGSYSPDSAEIAYVPDVQWRYVPYVEWRDSMMDTWKHYRGGQTRPIYIARLSDTAIVDKVPRDDSNDFNPIWIGDTIYFLSDRNGPVGLFSYNLASHEVREVVKGDGLDIKSASATDDAIVYEQIGSLHLLDLKSGLNRTLDIRPMYSPPEAQSHVQKIQPQEIGAASLSPTGEKLAFAAHGDIFSVTTSNSQTENLTRTTDIEERDPAWSPDGKLIAYFSDASGEYALHIRDINVGNKARSIQLGTPSTYYYSPVWSPDATKLAYTDKQLRYWYVDVRTRTPVLIDSDRYFSLQARLQFDWSPDGEWLAYTKQLPSHIHAAFLYSLKLKKIFQITDGTSDIQHIAFDKSGDFLYVTASTDIFSVSDDSSNIRQAVERRVYLILLRADEASPTGRNFASATQSMDTRDVVDSGNTSVTRGLRIDLPGIESRVICLPISPGNYVDLRAGEPGSFFLAEARLNVSSGMVFDPGEKNLQIFRFDSRKLQLAKLVDTATQFTVSYNGRAMAYLRGTRWFVTPTGIEPDKPRALETVISLDAMRADVNPRAEWRHMFKQVLRNERDFFLDPSLHGLDLSAIQNRYEPFLKNLSNRGDLTYLLEDMLGEFVSSHIFIRVGRAPEPTTTKTGLLGADFEIYNRRYRITRIYQGDAWDPKLKGPLASPGVNVAAGEYLLSVNGAEISPPTDLYSFFQGTAGKTITLKVGPTSDAVGSREIIVTPIDDEMPLRNHAWVEGNRRTVDELSRGRIGYVYLSDMASTGYQQFNRQYFAQTGKEGVIIDDRFNHGGVIPEYFVDYLGKSQFGYLHLREGSDLPAPLEGVFGPKVMLINQMSGSGGDMLPWLFRQSGLGPLVGKRTWGGLIGNAACPDDLIDGTIVTTPDWAFYNLEGQWQIENKGVQPDIEVDDSLIPGEDPQLTKSVEIAINLLQHRPQQPPAALHPPFPNYHQHDNLAGTQSTTQDVVATR